MVTSTVYVETTVIGHLVGRILADPIVAGRQVVTRLWWPQAQQKHRLFASQVVVDECSAGEPSAAAERLLILNALDLLVVRPEVDQLAGQLIATHPIPATEPRDAVHVSLAAVHGIEYLVTWNFRHIANPVTRTLIESICRLAGYVPPVICTPDALGEVKYGQ